MSNISFSFLPIFILSFSHFATSAEFDCLRNQFRLISAKINRGFESIKQTSEPIPTSGDLMDNIQPNTNRANLSLDQVATNGASFEIKTKIDHLEFLRFIYNDDLSLSLDDEEDILVNSICIAYLVEKEVKHIVANILCRRFIQEELPMIQFMKNYKHSGSKVFGDIFIESMSQEIIDKMAALPQIEEIRIPNVKSILNEEQVAVVLRDKYARFYEEVYVAFLANLKKNFENTVNHKILENFEAVLNIESTLVQRLSKTKQTFKEADLKEKSKYLLLMFYSTNLKTEQFSKNSKILKKTLRNLAGDINSNKMNTLFFHRLTDQILISFDNNHVDLSLYFELFLLPICYKSFTLNKSEKPVRKCKETFQEIYRIFFEQQNQQLSLAFYLFSLSPRFIHKFKYTFEKNFLLLSSSNDKISLTKMITETKKELMELVLNQYNIMRSIDLESLSFVEHSPETGDTVRPNNKITWALVPEIAILGREYPQLMFSFLGKTDYLLQLEQQLLQSRWFLITEAGRAWVEKVKEDFMVDNNIDPESLWESEFNGRLQQYSIELMGSEFQRVLELADKGVPNIRFLLPFHDRKVVFRLMARRINNCLSDYNILAFNTRAVSLAHGQLTQMIDKMITLKEFFYSNDLATFFNESEIAEILDLMFENKQDIEAEKSQIFKLGVHDYLLQKRVESDYVFKLGLVIAFETFNQVEKRRTDLKLEDFVKEYFKWVIAKFEDLSLIQSFQNGRLSKIFILLKRHLKQKLLFKNLPIQSISTFNTKNQIQRSLLELFYNSFISFGNVNDHQIKQILLSVTKFNSQFTDAINQCESREPTKMAILQLCQQENPGMDCVVENNFLIRTKCPVGTSLMMHTSQCVEVCPHGYAEDEHHPSICYKPQVKFRNVLDVEREVVMKFPSQKESEVLSKATALNSKMNKIVKREVSQLYKKLSKDFGGDEQLTKEQRSNVFERKYQVSNCPPYYEEFELFCIPKCPNGWVDQGVSCLKPMNHSIQQYLILEE